MKFLVAAAFAVALASAPAAHADELDQLAHTVCSALDQSPTFATIEAMAEVGFDEGFSGEEMGNILVGSVLNYCPEHTSLLRAYARS